MRSIFIFMAIAFKVGDLCVIKPSKTWNTEPRVFEFETNEIKLIESGIVGLILPPSDPKLMWATIFVKNKIYNIHIEFLEPFLR